MLAACLDTKVNETEQWMHHQQKALKAPSVQEVPPVIDTPPAIYKSTAPDPFSPARLNMRKAAETDQPGVVFPNVPLSALSLKGYLVTEQGALVGMVVYENQYRAIRVGDRLSEARALVSKIEARGVLVVFDGAPEQWIPISKP